MNLKEFLQDILGITLGTILCGIGFSLFLIPFKASPGGVGGLAQIFYYLFHLPAGLSMLIFNIPLFIVGLIAFGKSFGFKTIYAILTLSGFTDLFAATNLYKINFLQPFFYKINESTYSFTNEYFLAVIAGSLILGAGLGLVIKFNGSTGGTDIPALLLRKYFGLSIGNGYLIMDTIIIFLVGIIFKNPNLILWGMLSLYVSSKVCDAIIEGFASQRGVIIRTKETSQICEYIKNELDREIIELEKNNVIYTAITRRELHKLRRNALKMDPKAYLVVSHVHETI